MTIQDFEDRIARQKAQHLAMEIYRLFIEWRDWGFRNQIQKAAVSISNNIAEGFDRISDKDTIRFFYMAIGSCNGTRSMLHLSKKLGYLQGAIADQLIMDSREVKRIIFGLIRSLRTGISSAG